MNTPQNRQNSIVTNVGIGLLITWAIAVCLLTQNTDKEQLEKDKLGIEIFAISSGAIAAIVTCHIGLQQYQINKESEKNLRISNEFKEFQSKLETINLDQMLANKVQIIKLFPDANEAKNRTVVVNDCLLIKALKIPPEKLEFNEEDLQQPRKWNDAYVHAAIQDNFDRSLNDLEQFAKMVTMGIYTWDDLELHLLPWVNKIKEADQRLNKHLDSCKCSEPHEKPDQNPIHKYIKEQGYTGVLAILEAYQNHIS